MSLLARSFVLLSTALLAGCATAPAPGPVSSSSAAPTGYAPVDVASCGRQLHFDAPPTRIVSTGQEATEMLLKLGVADRIVGVSRTYNDLPADLADDFAKVPKLAGTESAPREVTLAARPDLVVAPFASYDFDPAEGLATVADLTAAKAQIFGFRVNCTDSSTTGRLDDTYADILDLGRILGVSARAEEVVAEMRATVADVATRIAARPPVTVLAYANGEGPLGVSGPGLSSNLIKLAGGANVFDDLPTNFDHVSIEEAAHRNPEAFVVSFYQDGPTVVDKIALLDRVLPNSVAAQSHRAVGVDDAAMNEGIRNADAVAEMARALHPDAF